MRQNFNQSSIGNFQNLPDVAYIRLKQLMLMQVLPYSATTIWRLCRNGKFPRPIKVSAGITAWRVGDIRRYLESISAQHGKGAA